MNFSKRSFFLTKDDNVERIGKIEDYRVDLIERIETQTVELVEKIEAQKVELVEKIEAQTAELLEKMDDTDLRIEKMRSDIIKWMFIFGFGQLAAMFGLLKVFFS